MEGKYVKDKSGNPTRLRAGGHTQDSIDFMNQNNIDFQIIKTYSNGVRIGNILDSEDENMHSGSNHSWFSEKLSNCSIYLEELKTLLTTFTVLFEEANAFVNFSLSCSDKSIQNSV